jgi:hypothetical protein
MLCGKSFEKFFDTQKKFFFRTLFWKNNSKKFGKFFKDGKFFKFVFEFFFPKKCPEKKMFLSVKKIFKICSS